MCIILYKINSSFSLDKKKKKKKKKQENKKERKM